MDPSTYKDSRTKIILKNGIVKDPIRFEEIKDKIPVPITQTRIDYPHIFQDPTPRKK